MRLDVPFRPRSLKVKLILSYLVILGAGGIEKVVELELSSEELASLHGSARTYEELIRLIDSKERA